MNVKVTKVTKIPAPKRKCKSCGKTLVAIGTARRGGTSRHGDWDKRQYHKKCLKSL